MRVQWCVHWSRDRSLTQDVEPDVGDGRTGRLDEGDITSVGALVFAADVPDLQVDVGGGVADVKPVLVMLEEWLPASRLRLSSCLSRVIRRVI